MKKSKIEIMAEELKNYSDKVSTRKNIQSRLEKTLNRYLEEINNSRERHKGSKITTVYKELNR